MEGLTKFHRASVLNLGRRVRAFLARLWDSIL